MTHLHMLCSMLRFEKHAQSTVFHSSPLQHDNKNTELLNFSPTPPQQQPVCTWRRPRRGWGWQCSPPQLLTQSGGCLPPSGPGWSLRWLPWCRLLMNQRVAQSEGSKEMLQFKRTFLDASFSVNDSFCKCQFTEVLMLNDCKERALIWNVKTNCHYKHLKCYGYYVSPTLPK